MWTSQLIFGLVCATFGTFFVRRVRFLRSCIQQGQPFVVQTSVKQRWRNMLLVAFGQKRMFTQPAPAIFHFFIYVGFLLINLEVLEIVVDGFFGTHRVFLPVLGAFYAVLLGVVEVLVLLVLVGCVVFLWRRNVQRVPRLISADLRGWPALDANLILWIEVMLMLSILGMNAADMCLQARIGGAAYPTTAPFLISRYVLPAISLLSTTHLVLLERACWWFHAVGIFAFAYYITYSKHLHIFLVFPNTYYADETPSGVSMPMPQVTQEVQAMLAGTEPSPTAQAPTRFGAKEVTDLSRKQLLAAFACTECGRCSDVCPAQAAGMRLSPRKIMMDVRKSATQRIKNPSQTDQKPLLGGYIQAEEINACTTCQACIIACPVQINPLSIILSLRQYMAMETDKSPAEWQQMCANVENNNAPWQFPAHARTDWQENL